MRTITTATVVVGLLLCRVGSAEVREVSGYVGVEGRFFPQDPLYPRQEHHNGSVVAEPQFYHEWDSGSSLTFVPFVRLDSADSERSHFDLREFNYLWLHETWELRMGFSRVFWGATEFVHLVDTINQTDLIEHVDDESRLGQPMAQLSVPREWGTVDLFVLPFFRERTFPGEDGRLRAPLPILTEAAQYQSSQGQHHVDLAARYSHTIGDCDFGIYYFTGTGRDPVLVPVNTPETGNVLVPYYGQIDQVGADVQWVTGPWLWKLEALHQDGFLGDFFAATGGTEYTFYDVADTGSDVGLIAEYAWDERRERATTPFENDGMLGVRVALNDSASTQVLVGWMQDLDDSGRALKVEASRRFGQNWRLILDAWIFSGLPANDLLYSIRDDDFIRLQLAYYFGVRN